MNDMNLILLIVAAVAFTFIIYSSTIVTYSSYVIWISLALLIFGLPLAAFLFIKKGIVIKHLLRIVIGLVVIIIVCVVIRNFATDTMDMFHRSPENETHEVQPIRDR